MGMTFQWTILAISKRGPWQLKYCPTYGKPNNLKGEGHGTMPPKYAGVHK